MTPLTTPWQLFRGRARDGHGGQIVWLAGLPHFYRVATQAEAALWAMLPTDDVASDVVEPLLAEGAVIRTA